MDILIIEDERLLADELEERLLNIDCSFRIVAKLPSIDKSVEWLSNQRCDLIFMDIQLSDGLSFTIFKRVKISCPVIFTTAYDRYAIQAFDVNSIAYLLKPIEESEIRKALQKYESLKQDYTEELQKIIAGYTPPVSAYKEQLTLTQGVMKKVVEVTEIALFRADDRYLFAYTWQGKRLFCNHTLRELESALNPHHFFRINRTFMINRESIEGWASHSKGRVKIVSRHDLRENLIVSQSRTTAFKQWMES